jgi:hypothetical protein
VVLHVDAHTLQPHGEAGRSTLDDGTRVSAETSRRLSCDAGRVTLRHNADGSILDVGRRTRTVPPAIRRALDARDRGCRFPGCGLRFTDAHHVTHWAEGGETRLDNLVLLCRHHHRLVHEGRWTVGWWGEGRPVFYDPRGGTHFDGRWQMPDVGPTPVEDLMEQNRRRAKAEEREPELEDESIRPSPALWKREADIPDNLYFPALQAMGEVDP